MDTSTAALLSSPAFTPTAALDPTIVALGRIALVSRQGTGRIKQIYTVLADGSGFTQLTDGTAGPESAWGPAWSPDGTRIAFIGTDAPGGDGDLYLMDADGTNITRLTQDLLHPGPPAWSPDARQIAFSYASQPSDWGSIYVLNVSSAALTRLTWGNEASGDPAWSPDGTRLVFVGSYNVDPGDTPVETYFALQVMEPDGSHLTQLTEFGLFLADPAWSPDARRIAFTCQQPNHHWEICIVDADGSNMTQLTAPAQPQSYRRWGNPTWSPDGKYLAFECTDNVDLIYVCVMHADGTGVEQIAQGYDPAWQPMR